MIALIGEAGSGKTTLSKRLLEVVSGYTISGDEIGHRVLEMPFVIKILAERFPETLIRDTHGVLSIHRGVLGSIVFSSKKELEFLNRLTHPLILEGIKREILEHQETFDFIFIEGAALIEIGIRDLCEQIIYIYSSPNVRLERLTTFRKLDMQKAQALIKAQKSSDYFRQQA
ncbi:MAG: dephospho-CoA kinase, partial [Vallitaleaceae bacterium]|nr:dephospho-CoA kinase [Vallitaleaceae bacterium]